MRDTRPVNPLERELDYSLGDLLPDPGHTIEVGPGLHWLRMPLPFALDHINLWLVADEVSPGVPSWTLVDCGVDNTTIRALWENVFDGCLAGRPIGRVIVTHMHPDHIGLAHWLCERWSTPERECRLWISATDWAFAHLASRTELAPGGERAAEHFRLSGLTDESALNKIRARGTYYSDMVPRVPTSFRRLVDGMEFSLGGRPWRCISGRGHSPEHMALFGAADGILIGGDMMLPRISTNVAVTSTEPEGNPLADFLEGIDRFLELPADTLVLPSHGRPFRGLHRRVRQLHQHHEEHLARVLQACTDAPQSAASILPLLFQRELDLHQTTFAMGEALAHLHYLWFEGKVERRQDMDGVWRFTSRRPDAQG